MTIFPRTPGWLLLALLVASPTLAQGDDEPLRPEEAYRYVVTDTGDALEIDWAIEDDYYLYRDELKFETTTAGVVLSEPRLPAGEAHEDEYFGKQQVFREHFYVNVPYQVSGARPDTIDLIIKSRGCWDGGLCYPPQAWTETVTLKKARLDLASVGGPDTGPRLGGGLGEFPPAEEVFFPDLFAVDGNTVEVGFRIIPGYYLYKSKISVKSLSENAMAGRLDLPPGKIHISTNSSASPRCITTRSSAG